MKRKLVRTLLCTSITAAMMAGAPLSVMAEEAAGAVQTEETAETSEQTETEEKAEDIVIAVKEGEVTVENQTGRNYTAVYEETEKKEAADKDAEKIWTLTLTDAEDEKNSFVFEDVKPEEWKDAVLVDELGIMYINAKDAAGAELSIAESCDERKFQDEINIYPITNVNIREEANADAKVLKVSRLGEEYQAVAAAPGWIKVKLEDGKEGYISHKYITLDQAEMEQLKKQAEEAAAQAAAAQAAAAQAAAEQQAAAAAAQAAEPVYEVSREQYDDCDGSGHGYYEITYSDGSVAYEDY